MQRDGGAEFKNYITGEHTGGTLLVFTPLPVGMIARMRRYFQTTVPSSLLGTALTFATLASRHMLVGWGCRRKSNFL